MDVPIETQREPPVAATTVAPAVDAPHRAPRRWIIGTLAYSTAGLVAVFGWLLVGDFAWQMKERAITPVAQLLMRNLHASDFLVGLLAVSLPSALNMCLGPIVSTWSDRHRGRWGRRIPYLLAPVPVAVMTIAGMGFTPRLASALHEMLGVHSPGIPRASLIVFGALWTVSEVSAITAQYLFYGLINDVVPKEVIGRFFGLFRAVSLIAGIIFNLWVIEYAEERYQLVFFGLAALYGVGFTLMCLMVKEGRYPPPPAPLVRQGRREGGWLLAAAIGYFRECFRNPHYLWIYIATTLAALSFGPVNSFGLFYAKSVGLGLERYGKYLALTYVISFAMSYPLGALADRVHPLRVGIVSMAAYAAVTLWGGVFATTPGSFAVAFVGHGITSGAFFTVQVPIFQRLLPASKFGQFYSAANLLVNLGFIVLPPTVGLALDAMGSGYRLTFLTSGILGVLAFLSLIVVYRRFMRMGGPAHYVAPE